ncbi:hypothetical protein PCE1_002093 [Barthelona sp. PCE]
MSLEQRLEQVLGSQGPGGQTLSTHLVEILQTILTQQPNDPFAALESISYDIKRKYMPSTDSGPSPDEMEIVKLEEEFDAERKSFDDEVAAHKNEESAKLTELEASFIGKKKASEEVEDAEEEEPEEEEEEKEPEEEEEEEEEDVATNDGHVPNLIVEERYLSMFGHGLGEIQMQMAYKNLQNLANFAPVSSVRLFGRIINKTGSYLVAEAMPGDDWVELEADEEPEDDMEEPEEEEVDEEEETDEQRIAREFKPPAPMKYEHPAIPVEDFGTGVNKYIYFVLDDVYTYANAKKPKGLPGVMGWTQLPHCRPEMIRMARITRQYFTGNLEANVATFYGNFTEKEYLRAQIARISHSTTLCPHNFYVNPGSEEDEEDEEDEVYDPATRMLPKTMKIDVDPVTEVDLDLEENEDFNGVIVSRIETTDMHSEMRRLLGMAVHRTPQLLEQGRVDWFGPDEDEEDDEEDDEDEEGPKLNKPAQPTIAKEANIGPLQRVCFDKSEKAEFFWRPRILQNRLPSSPLCLEHVKWNGAVYVSYERYFFNFYCGYGLPVLFKAFDAPEVKPLDIDFAKLNTHVPTLFEEEEDPDLDYENDIRKKQGLPTYPLAPEPEEEEEEAGEGSEGEEEEDED